MISDRHANLKYSMGVGISAVVAAMQTRWERIKRRILCFAMLLHSKTGALAAACKCNGVKLFSAPLGLKPVMAPLWSVQTTTSVVLIIEIVVAYTELSCYNFCDHFTENVNMILREG